MDGDKRELNGLEKASVLLMSLDPTSSARVVELLDERERDLLGAEIVKLRRVDPQTRESVLREVGELLAGQSAPSNAMTSEPGPPFGWLADMDPSRAAKALAEERPQCAAAILSQLPTGSASAILSCMGEGAQVEIAARLSSIGPVSAETVAALEGSFRLKLDQPAVGGRGRGLIGTLFGVLSRSRRPETPPALPLPESPEDLVLLTDDRLRVVLASVEVIDLCLVVRTGGDDLRQAVLRNVSPELAEFIRRQLDTPSRATLAEVDAARQRIVKALGRSEAQ